MSIWCRCRGRRRHLDRPHGALVAALGPPRPGPDTRRRVLARPCPIRRMAGCVLRSRRWCHLGCPEVVPPCLGTRPTPRSPARSSRGRCAFGMGVTVSPSSTAAARIATSVSLAWGMTVPALTRRPDMPDRPVTGLDAPACPAPLPATPPAKPCAIDGCDDLQQARGWCGAHYARWKRTGSALPPKSTVRRTGMTPRRFV